MGALTALLPGQMPALVALDWLLPIISLLATYLLLSRRSSITDQLSKYQGQPIALSSQVVSSPPLASEQDRSAYLLPSYIHHARMLPKESMHIFRYPTLYLAVPLSALEKQLCSLGWGSRLFRWNHNGSGGRRRALTALEAADYLGAGQEGSWLLKLENELSSRGYLCKGELTSQRSGYSVWATTMPSLAGIHGINPLTVYFIYRRKHERIGSEGAYSERDFHMCLLEVHNTFSERHLYILPIGVGEDGAEKGGELEASQDDTDNGSSRPKGDGLSWRMDKCRAGYDHQWTFPRSFHVSPFNDRGGYYRLCIKSLWKEGSELPQMDVRLLLLVPDQSATDAFDQPILHKKILATLSSYPASSPRAPLPLTGSNLLFCLSRQPLDLLLTFVRIVYQAAKLHYSKRLDVFGKPDMTVATANAAPGETMVIAPDLKDYDGQGWPMPSNATQIERLTGATKIRVRGEDCEDEMEQPPDEVRIPKNGSLYWPSPTFIDQVAKERFVLLARQSPTISIRLVGSDGKVETILSIEASRAAAPARVVQGKETSLQHRDDCDSCDGDEGATQGPPPSSSSTATPSNTYAQPTKKKLLTIYLMSPAFYSDILLYPSAQLAVLLGSRVGRRWGVSDLQMWQRFWDELERSAEDAQGRYAEEDARQEGSEEGDTRKSDGSVRITRAEQLAKVRSRHYRWAQTMSRRRHRRPRSPSAATTTTSSSSSPSPITSTSPALPAPSSTPLDSHPSLPPLPLKLLLAVNLIHWSSLLAERAFRLLGARYQGGTEPWLEWDRGSQVVLRDARQRGEMRSAGSEGGVGKG